MSKQSKSVRRWADRTRAAGQDGGWDQAHGWITTADVDAPCFVGVKLAIAYETPTSSQGGNGYDYTDGMDAALADLGCDQDQLDIVLMACGASDHPFGPDDWPTDRHRVWARLRRIEYLPANSIVCATPAEALAAVRQANHSIWLFLYGVDVDDLPEAEPADFWPRF